MARFFTAASLLLLLLRCILQQDVVLPTCSLTPSPFDTGPQADADGLDVAADVLASLAALNDGACDEFDDDFFSSAAIAARASRFVEATANLPAVAEEELSEADATAAAPEVQVTEPSASSEEHGASSSALPAQGPVAVSVSEPATEGA
jgi:hypothetical protein